MLSGEQKFEFLKKTPLFCHISSVGLREISAIAIEEKFPEEHVLFREGDPGESLYLLISGEVALFKSDLFVLHLSGPGTCFGEMALVEGGGRRSAKVVCVRQTTLLCICRKDFFLLKSREFSVVEGMFRVLNEKIREGLDVRVGTIRKEAVRVESMRLAREIQQSLLPQREISDSSLMSSGFCKSADVVGGDYYDYLPLQGGRYAVILADVMGHGYHSALLMAMTKSGLHTQVKFDPSVKSVMGALSRVAGQQNKTWVYLTCCYVILDTLARKLQYANAGHPPMFLYSSSDDHITSLDSHGPPLGLGQRSASAVFEFAEIPWNPGDVLLLYSDGITEAAGSGGNIFGEARLKSILMESKNMDPSEIMALILADLEKHLAGGHVEDDWTLVVIKFAP